MSRRRRAELAQSSDLSPSVKSLTFEMCDGTPVGHVAGQHVDLIVPTSRGLAFRRSYSIASGPTARDAHRFEIAVTRVPEGPTSAALHSLEPGARVDVEGPKGQFVRSAEDREHPALFVAAGTGLAPLRAMLEEEGQATSGPPIHLLFGCRTPDDRLWYEQLRALERSCPRFTATTTLSRPLPSWQGLTGYVQRHAVGIAASLPGVRVYVCGMSAMVDEVVRALALAGVPPAHVRYELYD
jgi:ferredoxin-NADP reductase